MCDALSQRVQSVLSYKDAAVVKVAPDGDCFFQAVSRALSEASRVGSLQSASSVSQLRNVVADAVKDEQLIMFWECCAAGLEEYSYMKSIVSLEQLRDRLRETGRRVGTQRCVWADAFAVQTVASALNIILYVIDDCGRSGCNFLTIKPERDLHSAAASQHSGGLTALSGSAACNRTEEDVPSVFLLRSRGKHYNLVTVHQNLFTYSSSVPAPLRELFARPPDKASLAAPPPSALPFQPPQRRRRRDHDDPEDDDDHCLSGVGRRRKSGLKHQGRAVGRGADDWMDDLAWEGVGPGRRVGSWREPAVGREKLRGETLGGGEQMVLLWHRDVLDHVTSSHGEVHQEGPDRVEATLRRLRRTDAPAMTISEQVGLAGRDRLCAVHSERYVQALEGLQRQAEAQGRSRLSPILRRALRDGEGDGEEEAGRGEGEGGEAGGEREGAGSVEDGEGASMTRFSKGTYRAARRAAGAVCCGVDRAVVGAGGKAHRGAEGRAQRPLGSRMVMCLVRPPGHHAGHEGIDEQAGGCGFCVVNNVVVGAVYALDVHRRVVERVAIIDIDVHHGNGTEDIVKRLLRLDGRGAEGAPEDSTVQAGQLFYGSVHLLEKFDDADKDFFPGSGHSSIEKSVLNLPLAPLWSPASKHPELPRGRVAWRGEVQKLLAAVEAYNPSLLMVSVGFDAAEGDEGSVQDGVAGLDLNQEDFEWSGKVIGQLAVRCCQGRVVSVLEGGYGAWDADREEYDRSDLAQNCVAYLRGLEAAAKDAKAADAPAPAADAALPPV